MNTTALPALALAAALGLVTLANAQPSGGPAAKGNAPLKAAHTVNDGQAKHGANSFTQGQAQTHIEKAGFTGVSGLVKGDDGVWRGTAMRGGASVEVAMDFKGNVTTSGAPKPMGPRSVTSRHTVTAPAAITPPMDTSASSTLTTSSETSGTQEAMATPSHRHHRRRHRHVSSRCAAAMKSGAACSGVDKNGNGVSDKEDRMTGR